MPVQLTTKNTPCYAVSLLALCIVFISLPVLVQAESGFGCSLPAGYPLADHFPNGYGECKTYFHSIRPPPFQVRYLHKQADTAQEALRRKVTENNPSCQADEFNSVDPTNIGVYFSGFSYLYRERWEAPISCLGELTNQFMSYTAVSIVCRKGYHITYGSSIGYSGDGLNPPVKCERDQYYLTAPPPANAQCNGDAEGNPCDPASGNKFQVETDYPAASSGLVFRRYYASQGDTEDAPHLGAQWRHNYSGRMSTTTFPGPRRTASVKSSLYYGQSQACSYGWEEIKDQVYRGLLENIPQVHALYQDQLCQVVIGKEVVALLPIHKHQAVIVDSAPDLTIRRISRPDGTIHTFLKQDEHWSPLNRATVTLEALEEGWRFTDVDDSVEIYAEEGTLQSRQDANRLTTDFNYDTQGRLSAVTGPYGRQLILTYNTSNQLQRLDTPDGSVLYAYEGDNLTSVSYPDRTPHTDQDYPSRQYRYEDSAYPYHLTGIIDANGDRYATWAYDTQGQVILSEHAQGAERIELTYNSDGTTTVSDALGASRTYTFTLAQGGLKVKSISGDRCITCANGHMQTRHYDRYGYLAGFTDWQGHETRYENNDRGLKTCVLEAFGTPESRMRRIEWHVDYRIPTRIELYAPTAAGQNDTPANCASATENWRLLKTTRYHYDQLGRLLSRVDTAP